MIFFQFSKLKVEKSHESLQKSMKSCIIFQKSSEKLKLHTFIHIIIQYNIFFLIITKLFQVGWHYYF
jgi:hypothetical protein